MLRASATSGQIAKLGGVVSTRLSTGSWQSKQMQRCVWIWVFRVVRCGERLGCVIRVETSLPVSYSPHTVRHDYKKASGVRMSGLAIGCKCRYHTQLSGHQGVTDFLRMTQSPTHASTSLHVNGTHCALQSPGALVRPPLLCHPAPCCIRCLAPRHQGDWTMVVSFPASPQPLMHCCVVLCS